MGVWRSKQQETNGIKDSLHDLLSTFNDLKKGLLDLLKFLDNIQQQLQETLSSSVQPVVPTLIPIRPMRSAPTGRTGIIRIPQSALSGKHSKEAPISGGDVSKDSINDVIARLLTELSSTMKPVIIHCTNLMDERLHTFCNQMNEFLEGNTPGSHFESNETKVKRIQTYQQSTRRITNLKEGRKVRMQIYISPNANLQQDISDSLCKLLRRDMSNKYGNGVTLQTDTCKTPMDIDYTRPLIVLCPFASRMGASVDDALSGVRPDGNVILLILHHVARHEINILSSTRKLSQSVSRKVGCILDMVFHSKDGMHICKQNDDTVFCITEFLSQYKSK